jgi:hypothetical protein
VCGQSGRSHDAGNFASRRQSLSNSMPHVRHL